MLPTTPKNICLSESQINQKPSINLELPNYKLEHIDSPTSAGGVAVYVSNARVGTSPLIVNPLITKLTFSLTR